MVKIVELIICSIVVVSVKSHFRLSLDFFHERVEVAYEC